MHRRSLKVKVPSASKIAGCPKKNYCDRVTPAHPCIHPPAHPSTHPPHPTIHPHAPAGTGERYRDEHCTTEGVRHRTLSAAGAVRASSCTQSERSVLCAQLVNDVGRPPCDEWAISPHHVLPVTAQPLAIVARDWHREWFLTGHWPTDTNQAVYIEAYRGLGQAAE